MANYNTYNATTVVLIIAAMCGIISFFSGWMCVESSTVVPYIPEGVHTCFTGYGMLDNLFSDFFGGFAYIPLYVLILSILSLIIAFLPKMGVNISAGKYSAMLILIGFVILIFAFLYGLHHFEIIDMDIPLIFRDTGFGAAGEGLYFAIIAGILNILVGALPALTRRL